MNPNDPNVSLLERAAEPLGEALLEQLGSQLRQRGFQEDSRPGAPLCRWCTDDLVLDLMPTQGEILGFANRWYPLALETAQQQALPSGRSIRIGPHQGSWPPSSRPFAVAARASFSSVTTWKT